MERQQDAISKSVLIKVRANSCQAGIESMLFVVSGTINLVVVARNPDSSCS